MRIQLFVLIILGCLLASCNVVAPMDTIDPLGQGTPAPVSPVPDGGIPLRYTYLPEDTSVDGIVYAARSVLVQYGDGQVHSGNLASTQTIDGVSYGYEISSNFSTGFFIGTVLFYPSGQLQFAYLSQDLTIGGVTYKGENLIRYHESGEVLLAVLSGDQMIGDFTYKDSSIIQYTESGQVASGTLSGAQTVDGRDYGDGEFVEF